MSPTSKSFAQDTAAKLGVSPRTVERTMQTMKGLTQETREVFHNFPKYKLSQSDAARLSRLDPEKQKTAAILLASGQIRSVDEYEPGAGKSKRKRKQSKEFLENVAKLKDPTKRVAAAPEIFLSEYHAMVYNIQRQISSYHDPYSVENISSLSQPDIDELQSLTDSCCGMMQDFVRQVREGKWQQLD